MWQWVVSDMSLFSVTNTQAQEKVFFLGNSSSLVAPCGSEKPVKLDNKKERKQKWRGDDIIVCNAFLLEDTQ